MPTPSLRIPKHERQTVSHSRARHQEREKTQKLQGAKLVPRSGGGDTKGDVRVKGILRLECKTTKHSSFSITRDMVRKIEDAALASGELPAIEVEFIDDAGKVISKVAVVPTYVLPMLANGTA